MDKQQYKNNSERVTDKNRLLSVLLKVSNLPYLETDSQTFGEIVLDRLQGLLSIDASLCYVVEGKLLRNVAAKGAVKDYINDHAINDEQFPMNRSFFIEKSPVLIDDIHDETNKLPFRNEQFSLFLDGPGFLARSCLLLPMHIHGRAIGSFILLHHEPKHFTDEDKSFGAAFAHQAAIEFENARLARDSKQRLEEQKAILQLQKAITKRLETNEVLQLVSNEAMRLSESDGAFVVLKNHAGWVLANTSGEVTLRNMPIVSGLQRSLAQDIVPALEIMCSTGRPYSLHINSVNSNRLNSVLQFFQADHALVVPIRNADNILGFLGITGSKKTVFYANDLRILILLSSSAVMGVENAGLYEAERILRVQEATHAATFERERLARELHDAVTQTLFSASLIAEVLPRIWEKNTKKGMEQLIEVRQLTKGALAEMRTLLLELRPKAMEETPLHELLKQLSIAISGKAHLEVRSLFEPCDELDFEGKLGLYRIAQEACNNIVKHAKATMVQMNLKKMTLKDDNQVLSITITLEICDNGIGFRTRDIKGGHLGIGIMKERAEEIGADYFMESSSDNGTCIRVNYPMAM